MRTGLVPTGLMSVMKSISCGVIASMLIHLVAAGGTRTISTVAEFAQALASTLPGDTVYLRSGVYQCSDDGFKVTRSGSAGNPIVFRAYDHERAVIRGKQQGGNNWTIMVWGGTHDVVFWDLEIDCFGTDRVSTTRENYLAADQGDFSYGILLQQDQGKISGISFRNCFIHDTQEAFEAWVDAQDWEVYGTLIFNNGWEGSDRGHGHGIYVQPRAGSNRVVQCILFNGFGHNIHQFGQQSSFVSVDSNIVFNAGSQSIVTRYGARNHLIATGWSGNPMNHNDTVRDNHFYFPAASDGYRSAEYGGGSGLTNSYIRRNWFGNPSPGRGLALALGTVTNSDISSNVVYGPTAGTSGFPNNTYYSEYPNAGDTSFVFRNKYDPTRSHVLVYNWRRADSVDVPVEGVYANGDTIDVRNATDYWGDIKFTGTVRSYRIRIPMKASRWSVQQARAGIRSVESTFPEFGAFVVVKASGVGPASLPHGIF